VTGHKAAVAEIGIDGQKVMKTGEPTIISMANIAGKLNYKFYLFVINSL